jgi:hypothetical protein
MLRRFVPDKLIRHLVFVLISQTIMPSKRFVLDELPGHLELIL